jgi:hypothetical protein
MTEAVRYLAHLAVDGGAQLVAGYVTIDDDGQAVHRAELAIHEIEAHGWRGDADHESRALALAAAAEQALADLGYQRAETALEWRADADPVGRWSTIAGAGLHRCAPALGVPGQRSVSPALDASPARSPRP